MLPALCSSDLETGKLLVEAELCRILAEEKGSFGRRVFECMSDAVLSGGKRLRPLLGLQVARALGTDPAGCLPHLAAVEVLHAASLIVDDLPSMDNAAIRRSKPAAHLQYGESIVILAAVALITLSIRLAETESQATNAQAVRQFKTMLLSAFGRGGLIAGQELDLTKKGSMEVRYAKTTPLFELACGAGLVCLGLEEAERDSIIRFGRSYGRAFQALDDFVDGSNRNSRAAARESGKCSDDLDRLQRCYPGFHRLRELMNYLDARRRA